MTLQLSFTRLEQAVDQATARLADLVWAIDATPRPDAAHALLDKYQNSALDLADLDRELTRAAAQGRQATAPALDYQQARAALITCQEIYFRVADTLRPFDEAGAARDRSRLAAELPLWQPWTAGVGDALRECRAPLYELRQALFLCWQSLSERPDIVHAKGLPPDEANPIHGGGL